MISFPFCLALIVLSYAAGRALAHAISRRHSARQRIERRLRGICPSQSAKRAAPESRLRLGETHSPSLDRQIAILRALAAASNGARSDIMTQPDSQNRRGGA